MAFLTMEAWQLPGSGGAVVSRCTEQRTVELDPRREHAIQRRNTAGVHILVTWRRSKLRRCESAYARRWSFPSIA
jgi:hypothetical protein